MLSVLLQDWAIFFPQKAVTLGIGNHERDTAERSFLHRTAARRAQAHADTDGAIGSKMNNAHFTKFVEIHLYQCSKHQYHKSRSLVTTLQKWQNKDDLRTMKNMDIVKDMSSLVSWLQ